MGIGHTCSWKSYTQHLQLKSESEIEVDEGQGQEHNEVQEGNEETQSLKSEDKDAFCLENRENKLLSDEMDKENDRFDEDPTDDEAYIEEIDMYRI